MVYLACTNQTGASLEDLISRSIPPSGEERTGISWTSEIHVVKILYIIGFKGIGGSVVFRVCLQ